MPEAGRGRDRGRGRDGGPDGGPDPDRGRDHNMPISIICVAHPPEDNERR